MMTAYEDRPTLVLPGSGAMVTNKGEKRPTGS
jgi:hypothetical protein